MSKTLWLDVDGVILEWVKPFLTYIKSPVSYDALTQYDLSPLFTNGTEEMVETINKFNSSPAYSKLEPLISKEELQRLKDSGYDLKVITQSDGAVAHAFRIENLCRVFGNRMFSSIIFTGRGTKKADTLREIEPYEPIMVVEDNPAFFADAQRVGGFDLRAIVHPYNRKELKALRGFPLYSDMREVVRDLCSR